MIEKWDQRQYWESSRVSNRPYEAYQYYLDLNEDELKGKNILEIGSGEQELFKQGLTEGKIKAKATSLNPKLGLDNLAGQKARQVSSKENVLAAISQELPFKEKSFDLIVALEAVPLYLPSRENDQAYSKSFLEMDRVLNAGGKIKIYPIEFYMYQGKKGQIPPMEKSLKYFKEKGYKIFWKKFDFKKELAEKYQTTGGMQLVLEKPK